MFGSIRFYFSRSIELAVMIASAVITVRTADFKLELRRGTDLEIHSYNHGMPPVQRAAKSLAVKLLYF